MRRKFHYIDSMLLMFVGFLVAFMSFVDAGYMIFENQNYNKNSSHYTYKNRTVINVSNPQGMNTNILKTSRGNLAITNMSTMITNEQLHYTLTIMTSINEKPMYLMMDGTFPEKEKIQQGKPVAVIGKSLKSATYSKAGETYILLEGDEYKVIGITGDEYSDFDSSTLLVFYDSLGNHLKQSLKEQTNLELSLQSNEWDTYEEAMKLYDRISQKDASTKCALSFVESIPFKNTMNHSRYLVDILLFLFCLINCVIVSIYWVYKRIHEIAVRSFYGYSTIRLAIMLWKEIISVILISTFVTMMIHFLSEWIIYKQFIINQYYLIRSGILLLLFSLIVSGITIVYPIYYMRRIPMSEAIYWEG